MSDLTVEAIKVLVPKSQRNMITEEFVTKLEQFVGNSIVAEAFKQNFLSYTNVLSKGKYKMDDYASAVMYVSYKLMNYSNHKAYAATFPERYQRLKDEGQEQIDAFVSMYNKGKLVTQIYEQTIVPSYVLNAPLHQEALNELAQMIKDPMVRGMAKVKACEAILNYTKQPEVIKNELVIGIEQQETISELREVVEDLAKMQRKALENKTTTLKQIAHDRIIDITIEDEDE